MRKLVLIVHTSLDGFVAGPQGELHDFDPGEDNLAFVASLTETADAAMFGRVSYELLEAHWPHAKDELDVSPAAKKIQQLVFLSPKDHHQ
jgi:dihydrofolate reductase